MKRVIGIGNALTDMLVNLKTDSVLGRSELAKGSMSLVDTRLQIEISKSVAGLPYSLLAFEDRPAHHPRHGAAGRVGPSGKGQTPRATSSCRRWTTSASSRSFPGRGAFPQMRVADLDGERTMATHLGAALELSAGEIEPSIFEGYDCLYVEGYLLQNHDLILKAARTAKKCGLKVAIDLASFNIVAENLNSCAGC